MKNAFMIVLRTGGKERMIRIPTRINQPAVSLHAWLEMSSLKNRTCRALLHVFSKRRQGRDDLVCVHGEKNGQDDDDYGDDSLHCHASSVIQEKYLTIGTDYERLFSGLIISRILKAFFQFMVPFCFRNSTSDGVGEGVRIIARGISSRFVEPASYVRPASVLLLGGVQAVGIFATVGIFIERSSLKSLETWVQAAQRSSLYVQCLET